MIADICFTDERRFTSQQLEQLFLSFDWESGKFPEKLKRALENCETVFTAWVGERLVGLANAIDDGELTAYVHYLLVDPQYQGFGIGSSLIKMMKKKYKNYLHFFLLAEHKELVSYYERLGFEHCSDISVMVYKEHGDE